MAYFYAQFCINKRKGDNMKLHTDLGIMEVIVNDSNVEIYYLDEAGEVVEGGEFSLAELTRVIQDFYESEF